MKANELMIGDWVRTEAGALIVAGVGHKIYCRANDGNPTHLWEVTSIEPIPLTPEILEKNGFEKKSERFRHYEYEFVLNPNTEDERYLIVRLHPKNENYDLMWAYIYYLPTSIIDINTTETKIVNCCVHEFQHALRLCGIDKDIELLEL